MNNVYYGLPAEVVYCRKCVTSNQRPNSAIEYQHTSESKKKTIHFSEEGVCDACRYAELKANQINWSAREEELLELCNRYRRSDGRYDCLFSGSGGKDSFYGTLLLKYKYKMNPLTVTWAPHLYTDWGRKNFESWIHAGFDNYLCTPNGKVHRLLTRLATERLYHPFQPFIFGQKFLAPKMATAMQIPLVFYGENEAEYGNPIADNSTAQRSTEFFSSKDSEIYLGGVSISELKKKFGVTANELHPYIPVDPEKLEAEKVVVHYLGYYVKWHPQGCYYYVKENTDFEPAPERTPGTYSKYNSIDDKLDDFHYYTTFIKFGIGRATHEASLEIRSGDITREEGIALVKKYDGEWPERFANEIFRYLTIEKGEFPFASRHFEKPVMDREQFEKLTDKFRSPHLWKNTGSQWQLRHPIEG